jgi:hypothetical protein
MKSPEIVGAFFCSKLSNESDWKPEKLIMIKFAPNLFC